MKYSLRIIMVVFLLSGGISNAQTIENWQPLTLNMNGTNDFSGVDAQYTLATCNNNEFILVQITNHNNYTVKAGWKDWVINTVNQKLQTSNVQDSVLIQPNSSLQGDCTGNNTQLLLKLIDFGILKEDFKAFMMTNFDFVIIHSRNK